MAQKLEDRFVKVTVDKSIEPEVILARLGVSDSLYTDVSGNIFAKNRYGIRKCFDASGNEYVLIQEAGSQDENSKLTKLRQAEIAEKYKSEQKEEQ